MNDPHTETISTEVVERLDSYVADHQLAGLAVGLVRNQRLTWFHGFGAADLQTGRSIDQDTLFRIASITKTFTTAALLQLRDKGLLSLDDPLQQHIPEFARAQPRAGSVHQVTLRRMLSHHSGLTTEAPLPCWDALEFPAHKALLEAVDQIEVVIPQDSAFKYSNLAFGLLGEVVARAAGRPYAEYLADEVLRPLGLDSTNLELSDTQRERLAVGYLPSRFDDCLQPAPTIELNGLASCGGLVSSVADLARWIAFQLSDEDRGSEVLSAATIEESHRPQYLEPDWSLGYCLGWRANRFGNRVFHGHGGGIFGFASQILFSKPERLGVICLTNLWPHAGLLNLAGSFLSSLLADRPADPRRGVSPSPPPADLAALLGTYVARPGIRVNVEYRQAQLILAPVPGCDYLLHVPAVLEPTERANQFTVRGGRGSGETIHFGPAGDARSMQFELGGFVYQRLD